MQHALCKTKNIAVQQSSLGRSILCQRVQERTQLQFKSQVGRQMRLPQVENEEQKNHSSDGDLILPFSRSWTVKVLDP